ncbi:phosphotransferase [Aneurinibacillus sp. Ricciae_BoGa-3]|uniref:phosphotransferase n=1 Tax=Aneurinibacillus sp. Ricciae_BoGa-3 TaxID=3022697 RepID=UPI002340D03F|nr:phosphotransferase [Aneurinibacillus sp. Ricciae_BoGa-3]WCK53625.1 phosphotransferase [Aneurinibacillus sp. Ricciae_BoGa-3]
MQDFISRVEKAFGLKVSGLIKKQVVLIGNSNKGSVVIKGYRSSKRAQWVTHLSQTLLSRGMQDVTEYLYTRDGFPYFTWNGTTYTVMRKESGRSASYFDRQDILLATRTLARFHQLSAYIKGGPEPERNIPLLSKWSMRTERFQQIVSEIKRTGQNGRLERLIQSASHAILREARYAYIIAGRSTLTQEYYRSISNLHVIHRDVASHNFIIGKPGRATLIDLDTAAYDTPIADLSQFVSRVMVQQEWDLDLFDAIINAYSAIRPLSEQDAALIFLLLRFPDNYLREVCGLYDKKKGFRASRVEYYLSLIMRHWEKRREFFSGYEHFLY